MIPVIGIAAATSLIMILSVLFFPRIKFKKFSLDTYWVVCLLGAVSLIVFRLIDIQTVFSNITASGSMNPVKIVTLFISMTALSIFLDEIGFFEYLASWVLSKAKSRQTVLFIYLYVLTSILTMFTANDIIILTFTPFICYFAKNAKINPIPYLVAEFVAANTWSMMFIIGNPTNIYLGVSVGLDFFDYLKVMFLPTMLCGATTLGILYLLFRKTLKKPILRTEVMPKPKKYMLIVGLIHLGLCTILLSVSSYIGFEMWAITLAFAVSLLLNILIYKLAKKEKPIVIWKTVKRMPWALIPFVLSMAIIVLTLQTYHVTDSLGNLLGSSNVGLNYGISSFIADNLINNIPMSILYSKILIYTAPESQLLAVYSTIIGSNLGAILTPIGALAGIMWMSILKDQGIKYKYLDFLKYGIIIGVPAILVSIFALMLVL